MSIPSDRPEPSNTYCALPWVHARIMRGSKVVPCCSYLGEPEPVPDGKTLQDMMNGSFFAGLRAKMLAGERVEGCRRCYEEEAGGSSLSERKLNNGHFGGVWTQTPRVRTLEFNLGNLCNLRCRGCSSAASTKWAQDDETLGRIVHPVVKGDPRLLEGPLEHLEQIKWIGGEPLLYKKDHEHLLRCLSERADLSRITMEYATNGTLRVSDYVLDVWKRLKGLRIIVSIDALGKNNDYFRHGSRWPQIIENLHWFHAKVQGPGRQLHVHTVVNSYNIHELVNLDEWLIKEFPNMSFSKDILRNPDWLDICNLPKKIKDELSQFYGAQAERHDISFYRRETYAYIEKRLQEPSTADFSKFISEETKVNRLWGYNVKDYHPHLAEFFSDTTP